MAGAHSPEFAAYQSAAPPVSRECASNADLWGCESHFGCSLRDRLRDLKVRDLIGVAARLRPGEIDGPTAATEQALRTLARRYQRLDAEAGELNAQMARLVNEVAPALVASQGIGTHTAATLLTTAGDNPERLVSEASFAHLCGVALLDASPGKQQRHRLSRSGDRLANSALHTIALVRLSHDERTKKYLARRTSEGKTKREAVRCLKRYIARDVYHVLKPMFEPEIP